MGRYTTVTGSLDKFERGQLTIIDDDPKHYCYSNVFEVASKSKPYDYEVGPVDAPAFRVEVKGTQGGLGPVIVTAGEVNAARDDGVRTVLAIVHDIEKEPDWIEPKKADSLQQ